MENLNLIWLNVIKSRYIDVLSLYEIDTDQLKDKSVGRCYEALLAVESLEQWKQWRKMMEDYGLAFTNIDAQLIYENPMGILEDIAVGAPDNVLMEFITWKKSATTKRWYKLRKLDAHIVSLLRLSADRPEDLTISIFPCGNRWAAIDRDADRIFEAFGWQTAAVWDGKKDVSWMFISKYGYEVLMNSGYDVKMMDLGEVDIVSMSFEDDLIAEVQQMIDYARMLDNKVYETRKLMMHLQPYAAMRHGYSELVNANIALVGDKLYGEMPDGKRILLADGKNWRLDDTAKQMIMQMGNHLGEA